MTNEESIAFALFQHLPKEIRDMIWNYALPEQQIIEVYLDYQNPSNSHGECQARRMWVTDLRRATISLLYVNREARNIVSESYERIPFSDKKQNKQPPKYRYFWINLQKDVILLRGKPALSLSFHPSRDLGLPYEWFCRIQNFGLHAKGYESCWGRDHHFLIPEFADLSLTIMSSFYVRFPSVKNLSFIIDGRDLQTDGPEMLLKPEMIKAAQDKESGREKALEFLASMRTLLETKHSDLKIPEMHIRLLAYGQNTGKFQRHWNYRKGRCRILHRDGGVYGYENISDLSDLFGDLEH